MQEECNKQTNFGFQSVSESEKTHLVGEVFSSVAERYDLMNDLMSFGLHRIWKKFAAMQSGLNLGDHALDVAAGSGDLAIQFVRQVGGGGNVVLTDINQDMLELGRQNMVNHGYLNNVHYVLANAEDLPFEDEEFDCVSISFGLRNVTRKEQALKSMRRVLKPGGKLMVLEFSEPTNPQLRRLYDQYSFKIIPKIGQWVANDAPSYRYLVESIRRHPNQTSLKSMIKNAGLDSVRIHNLAGGIVALHTAIRYS
ncbi:MAG: bifunctional demethylmenaquinone methyltransferase/2-methoxy-6-polyprenyl-1,4-benzoquinol methylase UbiE [Gammaproteobacteria bacterium]|nr:bifunctional demethylmenaquinone methyltransferase/2-methoxy-6-polyprenyl-1,4-benzoquinol methylase UbiE [Gammaproteobacteria bacterium]MCY4275164.1 bifunctional demethylmenaquinone methyltransferase/2-methoxy-6-polyprenyl-1,4-benzoquinol methylase UbiE [Gammaproteobacteria bacterium]